MLRGKLLLWNLSLSRSVYDVVYVTQNRTRLTGRRL